ncbi:alpha/beta fold hydrolase [Crossiella sp. CA198]|uniref:alpha/beta fold hydrolase n=1 Tax=Crossiella sp. CA198 TaxID=3455607 RepID=UPI003F8D7A3E
MPPVLRHQRNLLHPRPRPCQRGRHEGGRCHTGGGLYTDADALKALLANISDEVVLVGHSYGGMVITDAGTTPNIRHLVYLTSFLADTNQSLARSAPRTAAPHRRSNANRPDARAVIELDSDHHPFLSQPDQLTNVLVEISRR